MFGGFIGGEPIWASQALPATSNGNSISSQPWIYHLAVSIFAIWTLHRQVLSTVFYLFLRLTASFRVDTNVFAQHSSNAMTLPFHLESTFFISLSYADSYFDKTTPHHSEHYAVIMPKQCREIMPVIPHDWGFSVQVLWVNLRWSLTTCQIFDYCWGTSGIVKSVDMKRYIGRFETIWLIKIGG